MFLLLMMDYFCLQLLRRLKKHFSTAEPQSLAASVDIYLDEVATPFQSDGKTLYKLRAGVAPPKK
jgi:hypothetical protein